MAKARPPTTTAAITLTTLFAVIASIAANAAETTPSVAADANRAADAARSRYAVKHGLDHATAYNVNIPPP